ncbi:MAG: hypothetical protein J6328_05305 [Bacilli bacterium]|nr:hypothetical protein [Bacilli bacterium]
MSGPKYYDFAIGDNRVAREIVRQIRHLSGVSITVSGGKIEAVVSSEAWYGGINQSSLGDIIRRARQDVDGESFKAEKARLLKEENRRIRQVVDQFQNNLEAIKSAIGQVEARRRGALSIKGKHFALDFSKEIIGEVNKARETLLNMQKKEQIDLASAQRNSTSYVNSINAAKFTSELEEVSDSDLISSAPVQPERMLESLDKSIDTRRERAKSFVERADGLLEEMDSLGLSSFKEDVKRFIGEADYMAEDPFKSIDEFIRVKQEELKAEEAARANNKAMNEVDEKLSYQLKELAKISLRIAQSLKASRLQEEEANHLEENAALAKKIFEVQSQIFATPYLSRESRNSAAMYASELQSASFYLAASSTTNELKRIQNRTQVLADKVAEENEKHSKFIDARKRYEEAKESLLGEGQSFADYFFDPRRNAEMIKEMEEKTLAMNKVLDQQKAISLSQSLMASIGEERIVGKKMSDDGVGFTYTRPDNKGVIFEAKANYGERLAIYPRGVILSNGRNITNEEDLRKAHSSCLWSNEMTDKLKAIGLDAIESTEMGEEVTQSMYTEEEYYHCHDEKESIALLRMWGYSEGEIASLGYSANVNESSRGEERKAVTHRALEMGK